MSSDAGRRVTDPRALRALSHPVRLALLDLLAQDGPLTATQAAARTGQSPANCSFHLRTLARHGFIEEAGGGTGRQRPWRIAARTSIRIDDLDPAGRLAARSLAGQLRRREITQADTWDATRDQYPQQWRDAAGESHDVLFLTAEELARFTRDVDRLTARYAERTDPARRPPGCLPVSVVLRTYPVRPPGGRPAAATRRGPADARNPDPLNQE